jgi:hypothetical protein
MSLLGTNLSGQTAADQRSDAVEKGRSWAAVVVDAVMHRIASPAATDPQLPVKTSVFDELVEIAEVASRANEIAGSRIEAERDQAEWNVVIKSDLIPAVSAQGPTLVEALASAVLRQRIEIERLTL